MSVDVHELDIGNRIDATATGPQRWLTRNPLGFVVHDYSHAASVMRDKRVQQAASLMAERSGAADELLQQLLRRRREYIVSQEGVDHQRLRRILAPKFVPAAADRYRPYIREVFNGLLDAVASANSTDLVTDVFRPFPIPIICRILGAPQERWEDFSRWADDILKIFDRDAASKVDVIAGAQAEMDAFVRDMIEERRGAPGDDLTTELIAAEEEGDSLSTKELNNAVQSLLMGATDTTRNQLACIVDVLLDHPQQWQLLCERPELAARAVEEGMRFSSAVRGAARVTVEPFELDGVRFPVDTLLFVNLAGANRDAAVFQDPETFDIERVTGSPHMGFGSGIHVCIGAWLARAEMQEALIALATRFPDLRRDGAATYKPGGAAIFGPVTLPVQLSARHQDCR